jgi:CRP-like cAMP-binding protein
MPESRLAGLPLFAGVDAARLQRLEARVEALSCHPHEIVYRSGDPCDGLYVVEQGAVLFRAERLGRPVERLRELGAGEIFGEKEVLDGTPREITVRSLGETVLLCIPVEPLRELLAEQPFLETVLRTLAIRHRSAQVRATLAPSSRREPRIWVDREVILTLATGEKVKVRLEDLSASGACLSGVPAWLRETSRFSFSLAIDGHPELLWASAEIRWRHLDSIGVAFDAPGPALRRSVEQALRTLVTTAA